MTGLCGRGTAFRSTADRTRRGHGPAFKAQVAFAAIRRGKTMAELRKELELHVSHIIEWKRQLLEGAASVLAPAARWSQRG
jgi:transposase